MATTMTCIPPVEDLHNGLDKVYTPPHLRQNEFKTHQQMDRVAKEAENNKQSQPTKLNIQASKWPKDFSLALLLLVAAHQKLSNEERHVSKDTHLQLHKQYLGQIDKQSHLNDKRWSFYFKACAALITIGTSPLHLLGSEKIFSSVLSPLKATKITSWFAAKLADAGHKVISRTGVQLGQGTSSLVNVFGENFQLKEQFDIQKIDKFIQFLNRVYDEANRRGIDCKKDAEKFLELVKQIYNQMYGAKRTVNTGQ